MGKLVMTALIAVTVFFVFIGVLRAQQKGGSRVIYEENTSFEDAKHRVKILSQMQEENPQSGDQAQQKQSPKDDMMAKIMPLIEKFLGKDAASLLNNYGKGNSARQSIGLDEEGGKTEKGKFREFSDEHQWKGLRRTERGEDE